MGKHKATFKIVQLTDLHLTSSDEAKRSEPKLFGHLTGMNERFRLLLRTPIVQEADLILVTGDITDRGDEESWLMFWEELKKNKLFKKVIVIPGNHDASYLDLSVSRANQTLESRIFTDRMKITRRLQKGDQNTTFPWCEKFFRKRIAIFGLNSNHIGGASGWKNALGAFNKNQLDNLDKLLKENANVPSKIVLVHHSPHVPEGETEQWGLEMPIADREKLQKICLRNNVKLILHGHLHRNMQRNIESLKIIGAPASTQPVFKNGPVEIYGFNVSAKSNRITSKLHTIHLNK